MDIDLNFNTNNNIYDTKEGIIDSKNILFKPDLTKINNENINELNNQQENHYDCMENSRSIITKSSMMTYSKM